ncbi:glycosyltransferase [Actinacidiphila yeochonensis]|uniref:glycosyltransferase n=1 Tax=Actinacidiphila yeochonensis TaxID=89050 RepID=UPI00055B8A7A|nr:glycosyltransferase [Actinacidiphila yeochonensis]
MSVSTARPKVSVIIPTYNRSGMIRLMLDQLLRQTLPVDEFEVVIADDGSSDDTEQVVRSYADRLNIGYYFQEDEGFRVAKVRNGAARLASAPLLLMIDAGAIPGPDLLRRHLASHEEQPGRAVVGYAWGYDPVADPIPGLAEALAELPPEQAVEKFRDDPSFRDTRHEQFEQDGFDLARTPLAWRLFYTLNCSVSAEDFWAVGGLNEEYVQWGTEDQEFGLRLERHGLTMYLDQEAWVVEWPHERDFTSQWPLYLENVDMFHRQFPEPAVEMGRTLAHQDRYWHWRDLWLEYEDWTERARGLDVSGQLAEAAGRFGKDTRIAVFGCGGELPAGLNAAAVVDFDRELLDRAAAGGADGGPAAFHAIGLRTLLPEQSVDVVLITSRLAGLWPSWGEVILDEARRIGASAEVLDPAMGGE